MSHNAWTCDWKRTASFTNLDHMDWYHFRITCSCSLYYRVSRILIFNLNTHQFVGWFMDSWCCKFKFCWTTQFVLCLSLGVFFVVSVPHTHTIYNFPKSSRLTWMYVIHFHWCNSVVCLKIEYRELHKYKNECFCYCPMALNAISTSTLGLLLLMLIHLTNITLKRHSFVFFYSIHIYSVCLYIYFK